MGSSIISHWLPAHLVCPPKRLPCEGLSAREVVADGVTTISGPLFASGTLGH
jgi:hypothetical protein